ncbi:MAG: single-stranded-DNA-specific exonuclease RecJ [Bacillota bacterium]
MPKENARWQTRQMITPDHLELARLSDCHAVVAALLCARGYETPEQIRLFFDGGLSELPPPADMRDMLTARDRIVRAIAGGEKIVVYGDYDVDGITSTSTLLVGLRWLGGEVAYHIPHRTEEGYGLNRDALSTIADQGASVVVTVDCGISAHEEANHARSIGLDLIITDHHQPPANRVNAFAVVNPKQSGCSYPFKELAGVGVAYQLLLAVRDQLSPGTPIDDLLELVAMGTVADVVPLVGPNRIMVREGLKRLSHSKSIGLSALLTAAGLEGRPVSAGNIAFGLAPRLNACGRIGHADLAVELILTDDRSRAKELANRLDELNNQRQVLEQRILEEAHQMLAADRAWERRRAVVLGSEHWHPGVIGIVASRLVEALHRPVLLFSMDGEMAKGSGRSIKGFHLYNALSDHACYLTKYGGHELAAGLSLERRRFDEFRAAFLEYAGNALTDEDLVPVVVADLEIEPTQVTLGLVEQLVKMEPFGMGNPSPVFMLRGMNSAYTRELSQGKHFRARVKNGSAILDAVAWRMGEQMAEFTGVLDLVGSLERNDYNGQSTVQLVLRHWRTSDASRSALASELIQTVAQKGRSWIYCRGQREMDLLREQFDWERFSDETAASAAVDAPALPAGVFLFVRGHRLETIMSDCPRPDDRLPVLLLNLPYRPFTSANVRPLFGKEEISRVRENLLWLLPDRDRLATVYRWLRKNGPVDIDAVVAMLLEYGLEPKDSLSAAHTAVKILSEVGLVSLEQRRLCLLKVNATVNLDDSATFRDAQAERQAVFAWYEQITAI